MAYYKKIQAIRYEMPCLSLSPAKAVCQKHGMDVKCGLMIFYMYLDELERVKQNVVLLIVLVTHVLLLFKILPIFFDLKNIFYEILSNLTEGWT